jgi:hypothetical protein
LNNPEEIKKFILKIIFLTGAGILVVIILWSVATETLVPLYNSKKYEELFYNMFGIPVLLIGVGIFVYGGWVFVRDTRNLFDNNIQLSVNVDKIKNKALPKKEVKKARSENMELLFSTWKKGAFWLLAGAIVIIVGGLITNLNKILN